MSKIICEDRRLEKLDVVFSKDIKQEIRSIDKCNRENPNGLDKWYEYLENLKDYISNPVIAWDNMGRYPRFPNGAIFVGDCGYNVAFVIKNNSFTSRDYLYVFKINLNLEEFDLKQPQISETKHKSRRIIHIKESQLRRLVRECIYEAICNEQMMV